MVTRTPVDFFMLAMEEYDYLLAAIDKIAGQRLQNRSWAIAAAGVLFTVSFSAGPRREQSLQVTADRTVVSATRARSARCFMASGRAFLSGCSVPYADRAEKTPDQADRHARKHSVSVSAGAGAILADDAGPRHQQPARRHTGRRPDPPFSSDAQASVLDQRTWLLATYRPCGRA